jgi:hypothetical protein
MGRDYTADCRFGNCPEVTVEGSSGVGEHVVADINKRDVQK